MRPSLLDPLFAPATGLAGVGTKTAKLIERVVPADVTGRELRVVDLLFVMPHGVIDRRNRPGVAFSPHGTIVTLDLVVDRHQSPPRGQTTTPYRVYAWDETGEIALTFFHAKREWLERLLPSGARVTVSGRMEWFNGRPSMVHPDHIVPTEKAAELLPVEPVYPSTAGLSPRLLARAIGAALERLPPLPEWLDREVPALGRLPSFAEALRRIHQPQSPADVAPEGEAWRRLAFDELLAGQLTLALVRARVRRRRGRPLIGDGSRVGAVRNALPYSLTGAQKKAFAEIRSDMERPERMLRLLQGDVGSGKTVVALLAMAHAAEAGGQSALMAPTEILARQHHLTLSRLASAAGLDVAILTGREKGAERERVLAGLADGSIPIVVGTHALLQQRVEFRDLALVVVDEQHRFGVHQRLLLAAKGGAPDTLVMTATPIPRTLVLTAFGDMDVSRLTEKPPGRQPVRTVTLPLERLDELLVRLERQLAEGRKAYWICPLVEESEESRLMSAEERATQLAGIFGSQVGLVHGRMRGPQKDAAMRAFKEGQTRLLVATTAIEVGIDVPDATIIVIEHAERFGLAQLHQLRGRVGRGEQASSCVLLYRPPLTETARRRLEVMRQTEDGFVIAEEDLRLRGEGEILGTRQSGTPGFLVVRLEYHGELMELARDDARLLLARDPDLVSERGRALRHLLYLFGRDEAIRLLAAG
jgi:ATP-dependent DNA helicase RecG